jgi:hypothetical protein
VSRTIIENDCEVFCTELFHAWQECAEVLTSLISNSGLVSDQ